MGAKSDIQWTDATWTCIRARVKSDAAKIATAKGYTSLVQIATDMAGRVGPHCEHCSHGCDHCYSETGNGRCLTHNGTGLPFDRRARDLVDIIVDEKILEWPLRWKKPRKIFTCSQTDLFGEWVTDEMIDRVFAVMALAAHHQFQVLTKRPERMLAYCKALTFERMRHWMNLSADGGEHRPGAYSLTSIAHAAKRGTEFEFRRTGKPPLPNVCLGVSCEDQATADERIPLLLQTPAAIRFVSYEPALSAVDFTSIWMADGDSLGTGLFNDGENAGLDWVIIGGESGPGARPFEIAWARNTIAQCKAAGVPVFVKQLGALPVRACDGIQCGGCKRDHALQLKDRKGGSMDEWPRDLRVRQFPEPQNLTTADEAISEVAEQRQNA